MTRVIHYICNIKIKDFLLCQYAIYGPVRIILTEDEVDQYEILPTLDLTKSIFSIMHWGLNFKFPEYL